MSRRDITRDRRAGAGRRARCRAAPAASACAEHPPADDADIVHALNRLGFGPRPGDVERIGRQAWRRGSTTAAARKGSPTAPSRRGSAGLATLGMTSRQIAREVSAAAPRAPPAASPRGPAPARGRPARRAEPPRPAPRRSCGGSRSSCRRWSAQKILRAVYSERQLQEVLTDFWFNHFNVFAEQGRSRASTSRRTSATRSGRTCSGSFRDLLGATAKSPAMLFYLDNARSADPSFARQGPGRTSIGCSARAAGAPPERTPRSRPR